MTALKHILTAAVVGALALAASTAEAQTKKVLRIHTAGPNDINVETTMLAWMFANYANSHSDSLDVRVFANSQLGQTREVIQVFDSHSCGQR